MFECSQQQHREFHRAEFVDRPFKLCGAISASRSACMLNAPRNNLEVLSRSAEIFSRLDSVFRFAPRHPRLCAIDTCPA